MNALLLTLALLAHGPASVDGLTEGRGISLSNPAGRTASLLEGDSLASSFTPSRAAPLRLTDGLRFDRSDLPAPLDGGAAISSEGRQILALLIGLVVGFGIGHLIARDRDGFLLFLIVDIALVGVIVILGWLSPFWYLGALGLFASHIIQGLDAYAEAGGERIIQNTRERTMRIVTAPGRDDALVGATRVWGLAF